MELENNRDKEERNFDAVILQLHDWLGDEKYKEFIKSVMIDIMDKVVHEIGMN